MKRLVYIFVALIALSSCGDDNDGSGRGVRPPSEEPQTPATPSEEYNFDEELSDATSRIESVGLTLRYGEPGVMVSADDGINYELRDISTGHYALLTADGEPKEGRMTNASLEIDGSKIVLSDARIEQVNAQGVWVHLTTSRDNEHIVVVVTDM